MDTAKIKVLVVDDSYFMRKLLTDILQKDIRIEVIGTAEDGLEAIAKIEQLNPDVVTMDINMPKLDGKQAIRKIMARHPVPVIVVSAYTNKDAPLTLDCLELGAVDVVEKASGEISFDLGDASKEIIEKVVNAAKSNVFMNKNLPIIKTDIGEVINSINPKAKKVVVIGSSTGGPSTLEAIISNLDPAIPVPIVIAQHMPQVFIANFVKRLSDKYKIKVEQVEIGKPLVQGVVYIAPGDCNTLINDDLKFACEIDEKPGKHLYPSVDELFTSAAKSVKDGVIGIVLTGMGDDGKKGVVEIKKYGGKVIAQDKESSLIYGMPEEAVKTGAVNIILNPVEIAQLINNLS